MRQRLLISLCIAAGIIGNTSLAQDDATPQPNTLTPEEIADGWVLLFDGESLFGWRSNTGQDNWYVADGAIRRRGEVAAGHDDMLYTTAQFGNFEMSLECWIPRTPVEPVLLLRTSPRPADARRQAYYTPLDRAATDKWNAVRITANAGEIKITVNDETSETAVDPRPLGRGYIGIVCTHHAEPSHIPSPPALAFRNIKLRPLGTKPLFNGQDLTGWNTFPELPVKVSVTEEDAMLLEGGNGMVETAESFEDFTFQAEVRAADSTNSGVFYRCIPGEKMNGYECQINNDMVDGDPTRPADCGTGGIFRRQDARRIVARDNEWFTLTIHANDKHVATWVNGLQVCDWSDNRDPDPNPRRGLRLEPGTIQFQGHDPGTRVEFRNIRISEIPER